MFKISENVIIKGLWIVSGLNLNKKTFSIKIYSIYIQISNSYFIFIMKFIYKKESTRLTSRNDFVI